MRKLSVQRFSLFCCCVLVMVSGCASPFATSQPTPPAGIARGVLVATATPTLTSESDLAQALVAKMSLEEKLGQLVIVEFYGSSLDADLRQMIAGDHVGGVLIENRATAT